ncbi:MAG TPA: hypothetical protein VJT31_10250 [Rugosimonospora sp.]|nr:hypothetical protein [Rugosimonospora sp.]
MTTMTYAPAMSTGLFGDPLTATGPAGTGMGGVGQILSGLLPLPAITAGTMALVHPQLQAAMAQLAQAQAQAQICQAQLAQAQLAHATQLTQLARAAQIVQAIQAQIAQHAPATGIPGITG